MFNIQQVVPIKIKRLENCFEIPEYKTQGAAAMDLYAAEDAKLFPHVPMMISTGIAIALPEGYEAQIRARSGMASKGIMVLNAPGTIDSDYRGEVKVLLSFVAYRVLVAQKIPSRFNLSLPKGETGENYIEIKRGDRIAQMVIAPVYRGVFTEVNSLDETQRGDGGFGSTGTR